MDWSNLDDMEQVMMVYDELGGDTSNELTDLVNPFRKLIRIDDVHVRQAPFSHNKKHEARLYIFKDLLIIGVPNSVFQVDYIFSKVTNIASGLMTRRLSATSAMKLIGEGTTTILGMNGKYRVSQYFNLNRCHVKEIQSKHHGEGSFDLEITHVGRESVIDAKSGQEKFITKIEKVEISFPNQKLCDDIHYKIQDLIDELESMEIQRRESNLSSIVNDAPNATSATASSPSSSTTTSNAAVAAAATETTEQKKREWAKKKTLTKHRSHHSLDGSESVSDSVSGLSLADIESRYNIKLTSSLNGSNEKAEFEVQFGDGPMGLALGSKPGVGVVVGRLASGGFAEMGGVSIGDRVVSLNDKEIGLDTPWQKVVDDIKALPRPLTIKFERIAGRQVIHDHFHHNSTNATQAETPNWTARRAHATPAATSGISNLHALERMYKAATSSSASDESIIQYVFDEVKKQSNESEAKCLHVLKEIYVTEKLYVEDLRTLVGEYLIPLRKTARRLKCNQVEGGSAICEHNLIRSTCTKMSHEIHPIMQPEDVKRVFLNVETLVSINSELLGVLEKEMVELGRKCQNEGKPPTLGAVVAIYVPAFVKVMPFFKMYSMYCHKYAQASLILQEIRDNHKEVDDFLAQKEQKSQKTSLRSLLIKPIQRICKYPLLFAELLRSFPQTAELSKYHKQISEAAQTVDEIAESVNKNVGDREAVERTMEAYEELGGEHGVPGLSTAHRRFWHHNNCLVTVVGEKETKKDQVLYLFNDLIILAKEVQSGFSVLTRKSSLGMGIMNKFSFGSKRSIAAPTNHGGSSLSTASTNSSAPGKPAEKIVLKVVHRLDLVDCEIKAINEADAQGNYGFTLKFVQRTIEKAAKSGVPRVLTDVVKYEIWCSSKEEQQYLVNEVNGLINHQKELENEHKKTESEVGNPALKPKRSWREKAAATATQSIEQVASKYSPAKGPA